MAFPRRCVEGRSDIRNLDSTNRNITFLSYSMFLGIKLTRQTTMCVSKTRENYCFNSKKLIGSQVPYMSLSEWTKTFPKLSACSSISRNR